MAQAQHKISSKELSINDVEEIIAENRKLVLSDEAKSKIVKCRKYLDNKLREHSETIYGINTGFGALYNKSVSENDLGKLQRNLMISHACGTGEMVPLEIVRLMLLLKIQGLSYGNSGVQLITVERLMDFFNNEVYPIVYQQGSLGASGDLAPLAHLCLPLIGEGEVMFEGKVHSSKNILKKFGWKPIELQSKEGLALLNGTQFMSAYGLYCIMNAYQQASLADFVSAISLDAFDGRQEPFDKLIHKIRPHRGQIDVSENMRNILKGSQLIKRRKEHVQDPYSFRCIPQVHGASRDAINYAAGVILTEINSVTDNPTIFPDDDKVISAGNFHGQPLALAMDFLAIALAELGNISERRTYLLISGQRGLPPFLAGNPGLNSGFMIPQYTAASIVSQNKQYCTPASVDSIVSSNGQEDHVSMGANSATKLFKVVQNVYTILGIELMTAAQALEFRKPMQSSRMIEEFVTAYRKVVPFVEEDVVMYPLIKDSEEFLKSL
ncbi:MAG: histidine ammonia-lyase [Bacteroidia bacterium]|nr:histidine ammonia-lyase [Bacteroidota bacterium]MBP9790338.1 histidine ammonia-lyase [Bacteroidia bacterium]MBP9923345.1 histidine ammonia-lyase [Bacteroidia bacterium]